MSDEEVVIRIVGDNKVRPAAEDAKAAVRDLAQSVKQSNEETKDATRSADIFGYSWKQVGSAAVVGAAATAAVGLANLAMASIETADQMVNLRTKTGLSLEEIQRLAYVAKLANGDVSEYGQAVYRMGLNVEKGSDATRAAVARMGIEWESFITLSPEQKLQAIVDHLNFTTDAEERNAAMAAIFGRNIDNVLIGLVQHYGTARDAAVIMADESIESLARYRGEIDRLRADFDKWTLNAVGRVGEHVNAVRDLEGVQRTIYHLLQLTGQDATGYYRALLKQKEVAQELTPAMRLYIDQVLAAEGAQALMSKEFQNSAMFMGASKENVVAYIRSLTDAGPKQRDFSADLAAAQRELKGLEPSTRAQIAAALAMGESTKKVAEELGVTEAVVRLYRDRLQEQEREQKKASDATRKHSDALALVAAAGRAVSDADQQRILDLKEKKLTEAEIATALRLSVVQVRAVIAAEKERTDAVEASNKILAKNEEDRLKAQARLREAEQERGLARLKLEGELHDVLIQYDQDASMRALTGLARELQAIHVAEEAAVAAARRKYGTNVDLAEQEIVKIRAHHRELRDLATGTSDTIVERMAQQGYQTQAMLRESADAARVAYEQMVAAGVYSIDELTRARDAWLQKEIAAAAAMSSMWARALSGLPAVILGALQGGGDVARAAGAHLGTSLANDMAKNAAERLVKDGHPKIAGAVLSFAGPLGALGGDLFAAAFSKIVGSAGRDAVKEFAATMGGFDALRAKLLPLGDEGERLWKNLTQGVGKNNPEQAKKAIDAITEALDRSQAALSKYGITWTDMAGAAREAALADIVRELAQESRALSQAGVAQDTIVRKQADAYNQLLGEALRAGQEIPPAILPTIRRMLELGEITEENRRLLLGMTDDGKPSLAQMEDAMRTLGLEASDVGERFGNLRFQESATTYYQALQLLVDGGGDLKHMVANMSDEVRQFVIEGVRMGREFPAEMRDVLQAFIDNGDLIDENGEKLRDLSGIKFSESLEESTQRMIDKLQELIDALLGVPTAFQGVPTSFDFDVRLHARRAGEWPGDDTDEAPTFASGGMAYGPLLARIEPGRKELIGDISFMTEAIAGAFDRLGMRQSGLAAPAPASAVGGSGLMQVNVYVGTEKIDERIIRVGQSALQGQVWQVPATTVAGRTRF